MKNKAKKITAIGLGVCVLGLWVGFMIFTTRPFIEKVVIWLPDNYELENTVSKSNGVISIMPRFDASKSNQSNEIFFSLVDLDSFKKLADKSGKVIVSIRVAGYHPYQYEVAYQIKYCIDDNKSLVVRATEIHCYNGIIPSEIRLCHDGALNILFLNYKRNIYKMLVLSAFVLILIAVTEFVYIRSIK